MADYRSKKERQKYVINELKAMRLSFEPQAQEVANYLLPYRYRINTSDQNKGDRKNQLIYDSTATTAVKTLKAGFMNGMSPPTKRWAKVVTVDPNLYEDAEARNWLDQATDVLLGVFSRSNTYSSLPTLYGDMAGFATGVMSVEEHPENIIHTRTYPFGTYWIGQDYLGNVNTFYREFRYTVRQLLQRFGPNAKYSSHTRSLIDNSKYEEWVEVGHLIEPNQENDPSPFGKGKPFQSCFFETGGSSTAKDYQVEGDLYIAEEGFDSFPVMCGRWEIVEGDVYGIDCPGMTALGDIKGLQIGEKRSWQAIEKMVNPHYVGPPELMGKDHGFLPGRITWLSEREGTKGLRPLYEINPRIQELEAKLAGVKERIYEAFSTKTFRMLEMLDDRDRTATEIMSRREEGMTGLLPTAGNISLGVHDQLIKRTWPIIMRRSAELDLPPPPDSLRGVELDIEYDGIFAQAQKAINAQPIERVGTWVTQMVSLTKDPRMLDKIDWDQAIDKYAQSVGAPSSMIRGDAEVAAMRQQQAAMQQAQAKMAAVEQASKSVKNLAQSPMDGDTALTHMAGG